METCRLCLAKKKSDELVISLQDNVERLEMKIPFQSFLEYHCRIWFDSNPDLPQRLCKDCKFRLEMFIDFCNNVVRNQKDLILNTREKYLISNNTENAEIRENNANNNIQINQPLIDRDETPIIQLISDTEDDGLLVDLKEIFPPIEDVQAGTSSAFEEARGRENITEADLPAEYTADRRKNVACKKIIYVEEKYKRFKV